MVADRLSSQLTQHPQLADQLTKQIDDLMRSVLAADARQLSPPSPGTAQLAGIPSWQHSQRTTSTSLAGRSTR